MWCATTATFAGSACVVRVREIEELCAFTLRARPVRWVSLRLCTTYSASLICYSNADLH